MDGIIDKDYVDKVETKKHKKQNKEMKKSKKRKERHSKGGDDDQKDNKMKKKKDKKEKDHKKRKCKDESDDDAKDDKIVFSSALQYAPPGTKKDSEEKNCSEKTKDSSNNSVTLLLFYQYVEPPWDDETFNTALSFVQSTGKKYNLTGRMRVAKEGLNCTLTGSYDGIRSWCASLRQFHKGEFAQTEFKLTDHLPQGQLFPHLKAFEVDELVHYGLAGKKAPPISKTGTHLEPHEYHAKMAEPDTVIIDVRNHYESIIGHFTPPSKGAQLVDPKMRKSTEFPPWLDKPETKELIKNKQVLMYCTGGVRCERASALLRQKMETDEEVKNLNIKGVYQLQGGIDKYFKEFPGGGYWKGKNYTFDKRFAHAPPKIEGTERFQTQSKNAKEDDEHTKKIPSKDDNDTSTKTETIMGKCEACSKPWDMYRGKRRCPTCGVPSLICRSCFELDKKGIQKLGRDVKCTLCIEENITSKRQVKERERAEIMEYERRMKQKRKETIKHCEDSNDEEKKEVKYEKHQDDKTESSSSSSKKALPPNPQNITRLFLKNLCAKKTNQTTLLQTFASVNTKVTHIQWLTDRKSGKFYGSAFVEMNSPEEACVAVRDLNGKKLFGRNVLVKFQKADGKDVWPPPNCAVV